MRASPSRIGYIWFVCSEIFDDAFDLIIGSLRDRLYAAAKTRKLNLEAHSSKPAPKLLRPKPEVQLRTTN
ncbi:hypothetical protein ACFLXV_00195 [Chloroflexota bacterium]